MRAKEFINEAATKMSDSATQGIPGAHRWDELDNSSPYHAYRFGVALAGMPDYPMNLEGPVGQKTVTIGYTEADDEIIKATGKHLGFQGLVLTPRGSTELSDTMTTSPVANWQKNDAEKAKVAKKK
jgi:hypothetical protein